MAKKAFAMFLVIITIFSCMVLPASAATSGNRNTSYTLTVTTKANWWYPGGESITLSQSKGTFQYSKTNWLGQETGQTATKTAYGTWRISVRATDGSHSFSKTLSGSSVKLNLKANKTYQITIRYDGTMDTFKALDYRNFRWTKHPSWRVSGTWKVSSYY